MFDLDKFTARREDSERIAGEAEFAVADVEKELACRLHRQRWPLDRLKFWSRTAKVTRRVGLVWHMRVNIFK